MSISLLLTEELFPQTYEDFKNIPVIGITIDREEIVIYLQDNNNEFAYGLQIWINSLNYSLNAMRKVYDLQTQHKITPIEYEQIFSTVSIRPYLKDCNDNWNEIGDRTRKLLDMIGTTDYQDILQWKNHILVTDSFAS